MNRNLKIKLAVILLVVVGLVFGTGKLVMTTIVNNMINAQFERDYEMANYIADNSWLKHHDKVKQLLDQPEADWSQDPKMLKFIQSFLNLITGLPYIEIKILDSQNNPVISSSSSPPKRSDAAGNPDYNNKTLINRAGQAQAAAGQAARELIPAADFIIDDQFFHGQVFTSLIPILGNQDQVDIIIALTSDFSDQWRIANELKYYSYLGLAIIFIISLTVIVLQSFQSQKIINKQHDQNSEIEKALEAAKNEAESKSLFLANISHELRTPLNAIIGFSDIMKKEELGPMGNESYKDYVRDINNSGSHLLSLINDLLDYTKAEADKLSVDEKEIDVIHLAKSCLRLVLPRAEENDVKLEDNLPQQSVIVMGDAKRFKQVIINLLSNAVKFTSSGGKVSLAGAIDNGANKIIIQVIDSGIGISAENISKAMATFEQVDNSHSRKYEGTGLGLPLSKKLVELMNGKFHIQSEEGLGTTVSLSFNYVVLQQASGDNTSTTTNNNATADANNNTPTPDTTTSPSLENAESAPAIDNTIQSEAPAADPVGITNPATTPEATTPAQSDNQPITPSPAVETADQPVIDAPTTATTATAPPPTETTVSTQAPAMTTPPVTTPPVTEAPSNTPTSTPTDDFNSDDTTLANSENDDNFNEDTTTSESSSDSGNDSLNLDDIKVDNPPPITNATDSEQQGLDQDFDVTAKLKASNEYASKHNLSHWRIVDLTAPPANLEAKASGS